jgi:hypothetical protein
MKVYVLQHLHEFDDGSSDVKLIGIYRTEQDAMAARKRLSTAPGFRDSPEGFAIDPYEVGRDHWVEGYISVPAGSENTASARKRRDGSRKPPGSAISPPKT